MASVCGRKVRPVASGVIPRTPWRYSDWKYQTEKSAAPTPKATRLEPVIEREAKSRSGTSGARAHRPSMIAKAMRSAIPAANAASTSGDPHPAAWLRTIPQVTATRPPVTVKAPARSRCRRPSRSPTPSATKRLDAMRTAMPIGRLMKKIQRQVRNWVMTPPSSAPEAPPAAATALQTPRARARARPSEYVAMRMVSVAGVSTAPPSPWRARAAISSP